MGQKADPRGLRVGVTKSRSSEWFAKTKRQGAQFFVQDIKVRNFVEESYKRSGIAKVVIRQTDKECEIIIFTAKPALILGKEGKKLEEFQATLVKKFGGEFKVVLKDVRLPELSAKIMGEYAASQLEARMPFRRVAKTILQKVMEKGATGVKVQVSGRLGGVDLSRSEKFSQGRVSLQTLRSDIDYHVTTALTKY
jgi:small subunit ribosomal protein S3